MRVLESAILDLKTLTFEEQYWAYNGLDGCITFEVWEALRPLDGGFAYDMSRTMQGPAWLLTDRGVKVDFVARDAVASNLRLRRVRAVHIFYRLIEEGFGFISTEKTLTSPQQLKNLFYETLALPVQRKYNKDTKEYNPSVDRASLEKLRDFEKAKHLVDIILFVRDCDKKIGVLEAAITAGRMHFGYHVAGTMTGRWSSSTNAFGEGTNGQNLTDEMRRVFIPDKGKKFCQLDLAQAESKLVAYLSLPFGRQYLDACISSDLHTSVTKLVWPDLFLNTNESDKTVAKRFFYRHFTYRDMSKRGGHASNYLGSPDIISMHLKIPLQQAKVFQYLYFTAFPGLPKWHNTIRMALASGKPILTPLGRRCHFPGRAFDNSTIKSAVAYVPQSSIGDILNLGFYNIWLKYDKCNVGSHFFHEGHFYPAIELLTQVHDSVLFQYNALYEHIIVPLLQKELQIPVTINNEVCLIGVDAQIGWNWGKYLEKENASGVRCIENEFGLRDYSTKSADSRQYKEPSFLDRRISQIH